MCGIGAIHFKATRPLQHAVDLICLSESRGQDSLGVAIIHGSGKVSEFRAYNTPTKLRQQIFDFIANSMLGDTVIWCCRAQPVTERQNVTQPVIARDFVAVHNGVVANDYDLEREYSIKNTSGIDSEIPLHLIRQFESIERAFEECSGGFAYIIQDLNKLDELICLRDFKTLSCAFSVGNFYCVSEKGWLKQVLTEFVDIDLVPYTILRYDKNNGCISRTDLKTKIISELPQQKKNSVLVCASGGVDSTIAAFSLKVLADRDIELVNFDYGQRAAKKEWEAVQKISKILNCNYSTVDMRCIGQLGSSTLTDSNSPHPGASRTVVKSTAMWVPARNLVMMSVLAAIAEAKGISAISAGWSLSEEGSYPDNSIEFLKAMNMCLQVGTLSRPKIIMPLQRLMKHEEIILAKKLEVPLNLTWSCDNGEELQCGKCSACYNRNMNFKMAGIADPTEYQTTPKFEAPWNTPLKNRHNLIERLCFEVIK